MKAEEQVFAAAKLELGMKKEAGGEGRMSETGLINQEAGGAGNPAVTLEAA
ncbi:hypothetical protein V3F56_09560 [Moorellaceae bacterium AZ2]